MGETFQDVWDDDRRIKENRGVARGGSEGGLHEPPPPSRNLPGQLTLFKPGGKVNFAPHTTASHSDYKNYLHLCEIIK